MFAEDIILPIRVSPDELIAILSVPFTLRRKVVCESVSI
jgi:hypothetical protein